MKLEQSFTVQAPVDQVWEALIDVERVAPCLPGAEVTGRDEEGAYTGTFTVKIGPTTASYRGTLRMDDLDEGAHSATMHARGTDKRGQGGATATIRSTVRQGEGGTTVDVVSDVAITGKLARFGRGGMIEDVSKRLMREFAACLESSLAGAPAAAEAPAAAAVDEPGSPAGEAASPVPPDDAGAAPGGAARAAAATSGHHRPHLPHPHPPAKPLNALKLLLGVLWDRIRRLLRLSPRG